MAIGLYLFFGVCTTLVNVVSYWAFSRYFSLGVMTSTVLAWVLAVGFAYYTNRKWVFSSKIDKPREVLGEMASFFGMRGATGILDWAWMLLFVSILDFNDLAMKICANILVIILNFLCSKFIIFNPDSFVFRFLRTGKSLGGSTKSTNEDRAWK